MRAIRAGSALSALLALCFVFAALAQTTPPQVRVDVPSPFLITGTSQMMHPTVINETSQPITYCVDFHESPLVQSTPTPFQLEAEIQGKWQPLRPAPGTERNLRAVVLGAGESKEYPFGFVGGEGTVRLVLGYYEGARPGLDCEHPVPGAFETRSRPIELIFVEP